MVSDLGNFGGWVSYNCALTSLVREHERASLACLAEALSLSSCRRLVDANGEDMSTTLLGTKIIQHTSSGLQKQVRTRLR